MTDPQVPQHTVILTYSITAQQLYEMHGHLPIPLFVSENEPKRDERGWLATLSRQVLTVSVHGGSSLGGREQISVEFADDDASARVFDLDDPVEVHTMWPGRDLIEALRDQ